MQPQYARWQKGIPYTQLAPLCDALKAVYASSPTDFEFTYVMQRRRDGAVKVGMTRRTLDQRLLELRYRGQTAGCSPELWPVALAIAPYGTERDLHRSLASWRLEGEWFGLDGGLLATLLEAFSGRVLWSTPDLAAATELYELAAF